jgi:hypothetical protein
MGVAALVLGGGLLAGGCTGVTVTIQPAATGAVAADDSSTTAGGRGEISATTVYTTPEAAVAAYVGGIAAGDMQAVLAASAIEEAALGFDFTAYVERLQALPLMTSPAPAEYPLYAEMNRVRRQNEVLIAVRNLAYSLLSDEDVEEGLIAQPGAERTAAFVKAVDPQRLAGIEVLEIGVPEPDILQGERYQTTAGQFARIYGADDMTERVVLLGFEGDTYLLGVTLLRYGEGWKVINQMANLAGTSGLGTVEEISAEGFAEVTGKE